MSQDQQYPLLGSASYQRPATPQQTTASITRPDTIRHSSSRDSLKSASVSMTVTSDVSLTASDIRAMSQELSEARQRNELPRTSSSPLDAQVIVEDYGFLMRLREERGDRQTTPTETYMRLLVEITRRIKERDSCLDENEVKREAARRVSNYLSTLEHEQFIYNAATSAPSTPSVQGSVTSQVDAETFTEEVLSIIEQVADQTLLDATEPLRHHEKVMKILDKCLREDSFALKDRVKSLTGQNDVYAHLLKKLEETHQKQNAVFQLHDESLQHHDASLRNTNESLQHHDASLRNINGSLLEHDESLRSLSDTLSSCVSFYSAQNTTYNERLMVHNQLNDNSEDLLEQHRSVISSLQTLLQTQGQSAVASAQNNAAITSLINQLNAITMSIPAAVNQSVQMSVSQHFQSAMQRITHAQQQAMLALNEEESRRKAIDYDILGKMVAEKIIAQNIEHAESKKLRAKFRRAMKKLFSS